MCRERPKITFLRLRDLAGLSCSSPSSVFPNRRGLCRFSILRGSGSRARPTDSPDRHSDHGGRLLCRFSFTLDAVRADCFSSFRAPDDLVLFLKGADMGSFVNYWFAAFIWTLALSFACALGLLGCWTIVPESSESLDWEITRAGKRLLRARWLYAAACGVIFACLLLLIKFLNAADDSHLFHWFDDNRHSLPIVPMLLIVSSGLSFFAFVSALNAKGEGRRGMSAVTLVVALLSLLVGGALLGP